MENLPVTFRMMHHERNHTLYSKTIYLHHDILLNGLYEATRPPDRVYSGNELTEEDKAI